MRPRLLIVDDHSEFRIWARGLLDAGGFEVIGEVEDGASAMTAATGSRSRDSS
jgi:DNA-binding NarL/FixJ family response regulator